MLCSVMSASSEYQKVRKQDADIDIFDPLPLDHASTTQNYGDPKGNDAQLALFEKVKKILADDDGSDDWQQVKKEVPHGPSSQKRTRNNQVCRWNERYQELITFKEEHGHCCVPSHWPTNSALAQWVKRQRYQYKLSQQGVHSNLTEKRKQLLDKIGFVS